MPQLKALPSDTQQLTPCPTQSSWYQHSHHPSYIRQPQISSCCQTPWNPGTFQNIHLFLLLPATALLQVSCFSSHWLLVFPGAFSNRTGLNLTLFWLGGDFRNRSTTQRWREIGKNRDLLAFINTTVWVWLPSAPLWEIKGGKKKTRKAHFRWLFHSTCIQTHQLKSNRAMSAVSSAISLTRQPLCISSHQYTREMLLYLTALLWKSGKAHMEPQTPPPWHLCTTAPQKGQRPISLTVSAEHYKLRRHLAVTAELNTKLNPAAYKLLGSKYITQEQIQQVFKYFTLKP